jgi:hypothetical protein
MSGNSNKIAIQNSTNGPMVVWVEPWGGDFTLLPNEVIEIKVDSDKCMPWFNLIEHQQETQVYVEGPNPMDTRFTVVQDGKQLAAGHNRRAALDAGIGH